MDKNKILIEDHHRLWLIRLQLGLSQAQLGEMLDNTKHGYGSFERGKSQISYKLIKLLYIKYRENPVWIMTGEGPEFLEESHQS